MPLQWPCRGCSGRLKLVQFTLVEDLLIRNVEIRNSNYWTVTVAGCRNVLVADAFIHGDRRWPNNDALDLVDSFNVTVRNTTMSTGDDSICVSTHKPLPQQGSGTLWRFYLLAENG